MGASPERSPVDRRQIIAKFGGDYAANERTFKLGIDHRFSKAIAERFTGRTVLETCTGAGFMTMALARAARHVVTVEIDPVHQDQASWNMEKVGLLDRVTFVTGDVLAEGVLEGCGPFDSAFLDPDWAEDGPGPIRRFRESTMRPPADLLLRRVSAWTPDVALVLPPDLDLRELEGLPAHERQQLYLGDSLELYCLYLGGLARTNGATEWRA